MGDLLCQMRWSCPMEKTRSMEHTIVPKNPSQPTWVAPKARGSMIVVDVGGLRPPETL